MKRSFKEPRVKDTLASLSVRPSKERGQNFLIDESVIQEIVKFGKPEKGERLIEIGPGLGALTKELIKLGDLTVIEIEHQFCATLAAEHPSLKVVQADVREVDLTRLKGAGEKWTLFGNLPYSFSTDIVFLLIEHANALKSGVLLLQREFAERLAAPPGGRDYGRLSVAVQLSADLTLGPIIEGTAFHPPTAVQSRLVRLQFLEAPRYDISDRAWFDKVVKGAFSQRRKKLHNSLRSSGFLSRETIDRGLAAASIDPNRRAETLSIEDFISLASCLGPVKE